jgi:hypothetical protein
LILFGSVFESVAENGRYRSGDIEAGSINVIQNEVKDEEDEEDCDKCVK